MPIGNGTWPRTITVPFAWETVASGIGLHWLGEGWYRRTVTIPERWSGSHAILRFGAAHHESTVWIDGGRVIDHVGGQLPFEVDLTEKAAVAAGQSVNVVIRVRAPVDKREIAHGKQRSIPPDPYDSCSFTPTSGIWQSVWLEARPATYLRSLVIRADKSLHDFHAVACVVGPHAAASLVTVSVDGTLTARTVRPIDGIATVVIPLTDPRRWAPADPYLHALTIRVHSPDGLDVVRTAAGLRTMSTDGKDLLLNGHRIWLRGVLDQGYWPETGLTPPSEQAIIDDLLAARRCGFTLIRKHMKLEDPRWLWHADRLGMLVWAEPASTGMFSERARTAFEQQLPVMVDRDGNHPAVIIWGAYNEEWGLDWSVADRPDTRDALVHAYRTLKALDPTRPVVDTSGWSHVETDLLDWHVYAPRQANWIADLADLANGGPGGFLVPLDPAAPVRKYLMADRGAEVGRPNLNSEYGVGLTPVERAWAMRWQSQELRRDSRFSGGIYTELYDVEHEQAGVLSAARLSKDTANLAHADIHADTVFVVDLLPIAPGRDMTAAADGSARVTVHLSHHGTEPLTGVLSTSWGPHLGEAPGGPRRPAGTSTVEPFVLSDPITLTDRLPPGLPAARLHLHWESPEGTVHTSLDIVRDSAALQTPPLP